MTPARRALLLSLAAIIVLVGWPARAEAAGRSVILEKVSDARMEDLLAVPALRGLAGVGGAALLSPVIPLNEALAVLLGAGGGPRAPMPGLLLEDAGSMAGPDGVASLPRLTTMAASLRETLTSSDANEVLVLVVSDRPPPRSLEAGDGLSGVILARGDPGSLITAMDHPGPGGSLTSDSTRRDGVVTTRDVPTTVADFLGQPPPGGDPEGSRIRTLARRPPFELHERYLAMRRMWFPIQTCAALYATMVGLLGVGVFLLGSRIPPRIRRVMGWLALSVIPLATALLAAGHLPTLKYATVLPFVIGTTVAGVLLVVPLQRLGTSAPTAALGMGVLTYFVVESAVGWTAALTPFLGGSELDGGRFFGLPNVFIGLLIGASLFVAVRLPAGWGFGLIAGVGFFAGLPWTGSNLGASVSLFAAAGLWIVVRTAPRPTWQRLGIAIGVVAAGSGIVLLAHRYLTSRPTHVTRFEVSSGLGGAWRTFVDRLGVGWDLIRANPVALVPVIGVLTTLAVMLWPPERVRVGLSAAPRLAAAILVTLGAGVVAYVANDTGPAAAGLAFGLGLGGLLYVLLAPRTGMMGGR